MIMWVGKKGHPNQLILEGVEGNKMEEAKQGQKIFWIHISTLLFCETLWNTFLKKTKLIISGISYVSTSIKKYINILIALKKLYPFG
jgi:hypothetical protein